MVSVFIFTRYVLDSDVFSQPAPDKVTTTNKQFVIITIYPDQYCKVTHTTMYYYVRNSCIFLKPTMENILDTCDILDRKP